MNQFGEFLITKALAEYNVNSAGNGIDTSFNLSTLFDNVTGLLALIAGIIAFIYLVYSGILYLTAAGNPDAAKKGQQGIINAVIGLIIIVAAWAIISAVTNTAENATTGISFVRQFLAV